MNKPAFCAIFGLLSSLFSVSAADLIDPALVTGSNAIDPAGDQTLDQDAAGAANEASLEGLPSFAAIQNFAGWNTQGPATYIVFSDPSRPDVKGTFGNMNGASSGGSTTNASLRSSPGNSIRINAASTRGTSLTLDFGSAVFSGTSVTSFDSAGMAPAAVAFALCGLDNLTTNVSVKFYGIDDATLLSSQTLTKAAEIDPADGTTFGSDGYVGFQALGAGVSSGIGKVVITTNQIGTTGIGVDDLGFTAVGKSYYMTPAGAGTKSGGSWANALAKTSMAATLNTTMQPGDSLFLGSGNYGTQVMDITSSGTATAPKRIIGVDTGAGRPLFSGTWSRAATTSGTNHFINLVGTGGAGINGVSNWEIQHIDLTKCVIAILSNPITSGANHFGIVFRDINITQVRHGLYMKDADNMTIENVSAKSYSKHGFRLDYGCDNVIFRNCVADLSGGDDTWWDFSEPFPYGFTVVDSGVPNTNVSFEDCIAKNNLRNNQYTDKDNPPIGNFPGPEDVDQGTIGVFNKFYWNGDGFNTEENTVGLKFFRCIAINNEDGGYDLKQATNSTMTVEDCVSIGNSRNFRFHHGTVTFTNCVATFPRKREPLYSSNGTNNFWYEGATITANYFTALASGGTAVQQEFAAGTVTFTNSILALTGTTGGFTGGAGITLGTGTVTYKTGAGVDPSFVNPASSWDGIGDEMNSITYMLSKGYNSTR